MNGKTKNVIASLCAVAALAFAGIGGYMVGQSPAQPRDISASAFAADITEASTTVTKTVEAPPAQDVGSSVGPSNESSYEINIPASFSMDSAEFFEITASKMELEEKQELHVMVDYDRTFGPDGYFYLANVENLYLTIPCTISKGYSSGVYWETITGSDNSSVAVFNNIAGTTPDLFGAVKVSTVGAQTAAGTYTGKIYFNIQILNY